MRPQTTYICERFVDCLIGNPSSVALASLHEKGSFRLHMREIPPRRRSASHVLPENARQQASAAFPRKNKYLLE